MSGDMITKPLTRVTASIFRHRYVYDVELRAQYWVGVLANLHPFSHADVQCCYVEHEVLVTEAKLVLCDTLEFLHPMLWSVALELC